MMKKLTLDDSHSQRLLAIAEGLSIPEVYKKYPKPQLVVAEMLLQETNKQHKIGRSDNVSDGNITPQFTTKQQPIEGGSKLKYTIIPSPNAFRENRVPRVTQFESTFIELFKLMEAAVEYVSDKTDGSFIIPCSFKFTDYTPAVRRDSGGEEWILFDNENKPLVRRCADNVDFLTMLPADIDGGMRIEEARDRWKDYSYILYSSFNHMADGKTHKFRMLFEYTQPIPNVEYIKRRKSILEWLGGPEKVDRACLSRSQGFYLPTFGDHNREYQVLEFNPGQFKIDPYDFAVETIKPYIPLSMGGQTMSWKDRKEVLFYLSKTQINSYHTWWQMVQSLKSEGFDAEDIKSISANNPNHFSPTTGIKTAALCESCWRNCSAQAGGMGKLTTIIRSSFPFFRKKQQEIAETILTFKKRKKT